jgi:LDH2 family malate/lactate/ureidoglycolate dehydrogenase
VAGSHEQEDEMSDQDEYVTAQSLRDFAHRALTAAGMPKEDAATTARAMVWGDLRGLDMHGVSGKLGQCIARIRAGGTRADPALPVRQESATTAVIDGQNAWGQVAGVAGMRAAIAKAKETGVGVVSVRNVSSTAAVGYYPTLAIDERMIGIVINNGPALMAPWGGTTKMLSNHAHALGCPSGRHFPILYDSALTMMSTGEMELLHERGELLPDGVLLDANGQPTRDPAQWTKGVLMPIGGHRGYGLSLMFEILTGALAGSFRMAPDVGHPFEYAQPQGVSMFMLAIDPQISMPFDAFVDRVDQLIDKIHASPRAAGVERIYVPGERGYLVAQQRERDGIPLTGERAAKLRALADELGVGM